MRNSKTKWWPTLKKYKVNICFQSYLLLVACKGLINPLSLVYPRLEKLPIPVSVNSLPPTHFTTEKCTSHDVHCTVQCSSLLATQFLPSPEVLSPTLGNDITGHNYADTYLRFHHTTYWLVPSAKFSKTMIIAMKQNLHLNMKL